jgi:hypothetical protein
MYRATGKSIILNELAGQSVVFFLKSRSSGKVDSQGINIHLPVFKSSINPLDLYISGNSGSMRSFFRGLIGPDRGLTPPAAMVEPLEPSCLLLDQ